MVWFKSVGSWIPTTNNKMQSKILFFNFTSLVVISLINWLFKWCGWQICNPSESLKLRMSDKNKCLGLTLLFHKSFPDRWGVLSLALLSSSVSHFLNLWAIFKLKLQTSTPLSTFTNNLKFNTIYIFINFSKNLMNNLYRHESLLLLDFKMLD